MHSILIKESVAKKIYIFCFEHLKYYYRRLTCYYWRIMLLPAVYGKKFATAVPVLC